MRGTRIFPASFLIEPGVQEPSGSSQACHFPIPAQGPPRSPCGVGGAGLRPGLLLGQVPCPGRHGTERRDRVPRPGLPAPSELLLPHPNHTPQGQSGVCPIRYGRGHLNTPSRRQGCPETCLGRGDWLPGVCPFPQIAN